MRLRTVFFILIKIMANRRCEMGAMSVYQNSHVRIELFSYVKVFVYPRNFSNHLVSE